MAVSSGGWIKLLMTISVVWLFAGCSFGELPPLTDVDVSGDDDASWHDIGVLDIGATDTQEDVGFDVLDAWQSDVSELLDSGVDSGVDATPVDANIPEPDTRSPPIDVEEPEPDVNPLVPCARVKISHASGTTIRARAQNASSAVGILRKNSVVVTVEGIYGDSVGGSKVWYQIESPSGNGYIPSAHVGCTNDAPRIEPPPLSEVCPNVKITAGQGVNIRRKPDGTGYVGGLCKGSIVKVVAKVTGKVVEGDSTWYQIQSPNGNGYVAGKFAECTKSATKLTNC